MCGTCLEHRSHEQLIDTIAAQRGQLTLLIERLAELTGKPAAECFDPVAFSMEQEIEVVCNGPIDRRGDSPYGERWVKARRLWPADTATGRIPVMFDWDDDKVVWIEPSTIRAVALR